MNSMQTHTSRSWLCNFTHRLKESMIDTLEVSYKVLFMNPFIWFLYAIVVCAVFSFVFTEWETKPVHVTGTVINKEIAGQHGTTRFLMIDDYNQTWVCVIDKLFRHPDLGEKIPKMSLMLVTGKKYKISFVHERPDSLCYVLSVKPVEGLNHAVSKGL